MNNCKKECPLLFASLVELTRGKYAIVDTDDYERISARQWCFEKSHGFGRAKRNGGLMHRDILGLVSGDKTVADHINHNTLDNRKSNLRACSQRQNCMNSQSSKGSSCFKGVSWKSKRKKWRAYIKVNYKQKFLGHFDSEEDAANAYNNAAKEHFGSFALLNRHTTNGRS